MEKTIIGFTEERGSNGVCEDCKSNLPTNLIKDLISPSGDWEDVSYGNDEFASFTNEKNGWQLRIGDPNPLVRWGGHHEDSPVGYLVAFNVIDCEPEIGDLEQVYESDDLEMLTKIASHPTPRAMAWKHFINSKQPVFIEDTDKVHEGVKVFKPHFGGKQSKTPIDKYLYLFDGNLSRIDPDDDSTLPPHINVEKQGACSLTIGNLTTMTTMEFDFDLLERNLFRWSVDQGLLDNFLVFKKETRQEAIKLDDLTHDCLHAMYDELAKCLPKITEGHVNHWHQGRIESAISEAILDWVKDNDHNSEYLIQGDE